jgi:hypothetical protein
MRHLLLSGRRAAAAWHEAAATNQKEEQPAGCSCWQQLQLPTHLHVNEHLMALDVMLNGAVDIGCWLRLVLGLEVVVAVLSRHDCVAALQLLLQLGQQACC